MRCSKCGFNATVEQLHSVRLENELKMIKKILQEIVNGDVLVKEGKGNER